MKTKVIATALCLFIVSSVEAQLKVDASGNVGIGTSAASGKKMKVIAPSSSGTAGRFEGGANCIEVYNNGSGSSRNGIYVLTPLATNKTQIGVYTDVAPGVNTDQAVYGVKGIGGQTSDKAFGVFGGLKPVSGSKSFGIYGSVEPYGYVPSNISGTFAGFFNGDVRVTGTLYGTLLTPSSISNPSGSQANIVQTYSTKSVEEESVSDKLQQVQLLQLYRAPEKYKAVESRKLEAVAAEFEEMEDMEVPQNRLSTIQYGLAADQLKDVYPELVYEDDNGNISINYIEMVPLLVQALNETTARLAELEAEKANVAEAPQRTATAINTVDGAVLSLSQNRPNPFSTSTSIEVSVPESIDTASIFIFDMSGKQIKRIDITERGTSRISVTSEGLTEGMYLYSLIANGKLLGTKKMILAK